LFWRRQGDISQQSGVVSIANQKLSQPGIGRPLVIGAENARIFIYMFCPPGTATSLSGVIIGEQKANMQTISIRLFNSP
jgi:hypothetical protein